MKNYLSKTFAAAASIGLLNYSAVAHGGGWSDAVSKSL